jgi:hypothetical protein
MNFKETAFFYFLKIFDKKITEKVNLDYFRKACKKSNSMKPK